MNLKQSNSNVSKTEIRSRSRILFIFLIVCALALFAAQLQWVPNFGFSSTNGIGQSTSKLSQISISSPNIPHSTIASGNDSSNSNNNSDSNDNDDSTQYDNDNSSDNTLGKEPLQLNGNKEHDPFLTMFPQRSPAQGEKFLAYLPHSGFHNQLITLENALRLSVYLNRTLLLPPLYLSHKRQALVWKETPVLLQQWADRNRTNVDYCRDMDPSSWPRRTRKQRQRMTEEERKAEKECLFYHAWTSTTWTYFYDIPKLLTGIVGVAGQKEPIRVFSRPDMGVKWLEENLNLKDPINDIYFINDTSRYSYKIIDDSEAAYRVNPEADAIAADGLTPYQIAYRTRYEKQLLLSDLQRRPETVLHFGSLFATDRVEARSERHIELKSYISHSMDLWNQAILDATRLAEKQMSEWSKLTGRIAPEFLGVHFRTEDGQFERLAPRNLQRIVAWIQEMVMQDRKYLENDQTLDVAWPEPSLSVEPVEPVESTFLERCMGSPPESPMIFMATDVHQPRRSPMLSKFLNQFPCTMFLSDFVESVAILDKIHNPVDGVHMLPYMIALMDANLAAKGREFQGTERSTFTAYIMHHLWPEYHQERMSEETE